MKLLKLLRKMKQQVSAKNKSRSKELRNSFLGLSGDLFQDLQEFKRKRISESKTFLYWDRFFWNCSVGKWPRDAWQRRRLASAPAICRSIIAIICGLWLHQLSAVVFPLPGGHEEAIRDGTSCPWQFHGWRFVVKRSFIHSLLLLPTCVWNRQSTVHLRQAGESLGNTKRKEFVTRWNIIHHKLMSINQTFREVTGVQLNNTELTVNRSFSRRQTEENES